MAASGSAAPAPPSSAFLGARAVPGSVDQVLKLSGYQLKEYVLSRRFVILLAVVAAIGAIATVVIGHYRGDTVSTNLTFYGTLWGGGGASVVVVLAAVFFGGDAIAGEFQSRTGYFLMGLPIRRATVYAGKFIAAFLASTATLLFFLLILVGNGLFYFGAGAFPWQLGVSVGVAIVYLAAVLGTTFLFSSLFKTSAYGFVLTAILFLFGFTILQDLVTGLIQVEPWMVISYASGVIPELFAPGIPWGLVGSKSTMMGPTGREATVWSPGVAEGVVIMAAYFIITTIAGLVLFEREEFN